ncbi:MAG: methyltransferase domain-containing protein [Dehalococcoidia bacterium]
MGVQVNREELEAQVQEMYRAVAEKPQGEFHFETGRGLAERLGYSAEDLERVPPEAVESFAGVGYHFDLADIQAGEKVIDLGSGSGMDAFVAALKAGKSGGVAGVDMTEAQLAKAERLRVSRGITNVSFHNGYCEAIPLESESFDVAISNGVINLCGDKRKVFQEVSRVLKRGGRLAISDIISDKMLPETITCDATLWASCIGGAMQVDEYRAAIEAAGFQVVNVRENPQYKFLSGSAQGACQEFGVKSASLLAVKR